MNYKKVYLIFLQDLLISRVNKNILKNKGFFFKNKDFFKNVDLIKNNNFYTLNIFLKITFICWIVK
jgi:hypothetical protein